MDERKPRRLKPNETLVKWQRHEKHRANKFRRGDIVRLTRTAPQCPRQIGVLSDRRLWVREAEQFGRDFDGHWAEVTTAEHSAGTSGIGMFSHYDVPECTVRYPNGKTLRAPVAFFDLVAKRSTTVAA